MPYARFSTEAENNPAYDAGGLVARNPLDAVIAGEAAKGLARANPSQGPN